MGIFANILEKLGLGHQPSQRDERPYGPKTVPTDGAINGAGGTFAPPDAVPVMAKAPVKPVAISEVDVVGQLEKRAAANPQKLDWRTSIVDLLKLLDLDSSLDERKALAKELGAPQREMGYSSDMNLWLHQEVLRRIAENGGNIPASLLY